MFRQALISLIRAVTVEINQPLIDRIDELERWIKYSHTQPGNVQLTINSETTMSQQDVLGFKLNLQGIWPEEPNDVASASVSVTTRVTDESGEQKEVVTSLAVVKGQQELEHADFRGDEDSDACVEVCLIDNNNVKGTPKKQTFLLVDTIAPGVAGDIGVVVTRETTVDTPDVDAGPTASEGPRSNCR